MTGVYLSHKKDQFMKQLEGNFWRNTVKPQFDRLNLIYKRIESPITSGFPDTIILYNKRVIFLELKSKPSFERYLGCSALQENFHRTWSAQGATTFVLAQVKEYIYLVPGALIPLHPDHAIATRNAVLHGPRKAFEWSQLPSCFPKE